MAVVLPWKQVDLGSRNIHYVDRHFPASSPSQKDFRPHIDVDSSEITGSTVTRFDHCGKYTFTADHDKPEAANQALMHTIKRLTVVGITIGEAINVHFANTLSSNPDAAC